MKKPTKEQKYDFINKYLMELTVGQKETVLIEGRVYDMKYRGLENQVFLPLGKEASQ